MANNTVPRQLLVEANEAVEKLKRKLEEATIAGRKEMDAALESMTSQLKTLQAQQKKLEEQLNRSMQREKELRQANGDFTSSVGRLRAENENLRTRVEELSQQKLIDKAKTEEMDLLKNQLYTLRQELENAKTAYDAELSRMKQDTHDKALEEATELNRKIDSLKNDLAKSEARNAVLSAEVESLNKSLTQAQSMVNIADTNTAQLAEEIATLRDEWSSCQSQLKEQQFRSEGLAQSLDALQQQIGQAENELSQERLSKADLLRKLQESENSLISSQDSSKVEADNAKQQIERLSQQLAETLNKLTETNSELKRSEADFKGIRDQLRDELRKFESENQQLRDSLRQERERNEREMREHAHMLDEQLQQRQRLEVAASKREDALQKRLQHVEMELESLRSTSIPETQHQNLIEEMKVEREQTLKKLKMAQEEAQKLEDHLKGIIARLETRIGEAEESAAEMNFRIRTLEKKVKDTEKLAALERKQRQHASEQVKLLTGDPSVNLKGDNLNPSKMAEAAVTILDGAQELCEKAVLRAIKAEVVNEGPFVQQKTALGIVLNETHVDATIPGSPAFACGEIERLDEILMVDGQKINIEMASNALRGDDTVGSVASIMLRKASTGEVVIVNIPRIEIATVKLRQELHEALSKIRNDAVAAMKTGNTALVVERFSQIESHVLRLDQLNVVVQQRLSAQVAILKEGLEDVISKSKAAVLDVDASHQQVHMLQSLTEAELREYLSDLHEEDEGIRKDRETTLHKHVQELEGDLKALQEELSATQMLRREALEHAEIFRTKEQNLWEQSTLLQQGQKSMRETIATLEDQLAEAVADVLDHPFVIAVTVNREFEATMKDTDARINFETQLREDVSTALRVPLSVVHVLGYHRGSVVAAIKLSSVIPGPGAPSDGLRTGKMLAFELADQVQDHSAPLHEGLLGKQIVAVEVHGPISELTAKSFKAIVADKEREQTRKEEELIKMRQMITDLKVQCNAVIEELKKQSDAQIQASEQKTKQILNARKQEILQALESEREKIHAEQDLVRLNAEKAYRTDKEQVQQEYKRMEADMLQKISQYESEIESYKDRIYNLELALSNANRDTKTSYESMCRIREEFARYKRKCQQVEEMIIAELKSCVMNLNNMESEMGFFHAYHMRAMSIANTTGNTQNGSNISTVKDDVARSKEMMQMMQRDIQTLKSQLGVLTAFSYSDPFLLSEQLGQTLIAPSSSKHNVHVSPSAAVTSPLMSKTSISPILHGSLSPSDRPASSPGPGKKSSNLSPGPKRTITAFIDVPTNFVNQSGLNHSTSVVSALKYDSERNNSPPNGKLVFDGRYHAGLEPNSRSSLVDPWNREDDRNGCDSEQRSLLKTANAVQRSKEASFLRIKIIEAQDLPCGPSGLQSQEFFVCVSVFHHLTQLQFVSHRVDSVQNPTGQDAWIVRRGKRIFRFKPQYRTQTKVCTSNPRWEEEAHLTEMHALLPVIQDEEKRMNTWFLRSTMMMKIEAKPLAILLTIHSSSDTFASEPIGRISLTMNPCTEINQWYKIYTEDGSPLICDKGRSALIRLQVLYSTQEPPRQSTS